MFALPARLDDVQNNTLARSFECLLAEKVRQNPVLYDRKLEQHPSTSSPHTNKQVWLKISKQLHLELDSCISLWACIRQRFIKHRKRLSNGSTSTIKHWPLYDQLKLWLDKHIKRRRSQSDICHEIRTSRTLSTSPAASTTIIKKRLPMPTKTMMDSEHVFVDSIDSAEWCEIPENSESNHQSSRKQPTMKRKATKIYPTSSAKRIFKSETISNTTDSSDIFTELDDCPKPKPTPKPQQIKFVSAKKEVVKKVAKPCVVSAVAVTKLLPIVKTQETIKAPLDISPKKEPNTEALPIQQITPTVQPIIPSESNQQSSSFEGILKLESVIERCVQLVEKCITQNSLKKDSNEIFGNFVSSMVRELPIEKRIAARVEILQFTGDLIARLSNDTK